MVIYMYCDGLVRDGKSIGMDFLKPMSVLKTNKYQKKIFKKC